MIRRSTIPSIELQLTGLHAFPDPEATTQMAAFDALPSQVRYFLVDCPFDFRATKARDMVQREGARYTLGAMRASVASERRRWAIERQQALEWARDAFRIGPRPRHDPPPGGWTVHNFPG